MRLLTTNTKEPETIDDNSTADAAPAQKELPRYQSIKKVHALKMKSLVTSEDGTATFTPAEEGYAPIKLDAEFVSKHKPQAGGYYVVYKDGYKSWSPAEAFEEGYFLEPCNVDIPQDEDDVRDAEEGGEDDDDDDDEEGGE